MIAILVDDGFEELELGAAISVLSRGGLNWELVGVEERAEGAGGLRLDVDVTVWEASGERYEAVIVPGGTSPTTLSGYRRCLELVRTVRERGLVVGLSAGALVLAEAGVLEGRRATTYPGLEAELRTRGAEPVERGLVRDGRVITTRGPAFAVDACLEVVRELAGDHLANSVARQLILK
ncbi:MAG: DJ-1/PfpI family protein [Euryarchaeota archaeon]